MKKQTAVQWLAQQLQAGKELSIVLPQALQMEEDQIQRDFAQGEISDADYFDPENPEASCAENYFKETYK